MTLASASADKEEVEALKERLALLDHVSGILSSSRIICTHARIERMRPVWYRYVFI